MSPISSRNHLTTYQYISYFDKIWDIFRYIWLFPDSKTLLVSAAAFSPDGFGFWAHLPMGDWHQSRGRGMCGGSCGWMEIQKGIVLFNRTSEIIWDHLRSSEIIWDHLRSFEIMWVWWQVPNQIPGYSRDLKSKCFRAWLSASWQAGTGSLFERIPAKLNRCQCVAAESVFPAPLENVCTGSIWINKILVTVHLGGYHFTDIQRIF